MTSTASEEPRQEGRHSPGVAEGMTRYQCTPQAFDDLFDIWTYIAQDNLDAANRVEQEIYNSCERLALSPLASDDCTTRAGAL